MNYFFSFGKTNRKFLNGPFLFSIILLLALAFPSKAWAPQIIEQLSAVMETKQVQAGKSVTIKGQMFYQRNGNLVTRFVYPKEYIVLANKQGEVKIYDPGKNTVMRYQNFLFSTQSSQFYYFFSGKSSDMGLTDIGYVQEKTYSENGLLVTLWKLKTPDKKASVQKVKLVYNRQDPIYMHYENAAGKIFRKVFYYQYIQLETTKFPSVTTEISYDDSGDSTVSKTSYADFKLNHQANKEYMNYRIPANAKLEK
jgi:hypothetical protein